jgi:hypothetical protein
MHVKIELKEIQKTLTIYKSKSYLWFCCRLSYRWFRQLFDPVDNPATNQVVEEKNVWPSM